jgi:hypothetical protein
MGHFAAVACFCLGLTVSSTAWAAPIVLRFDELPPLTPVHALSIQGVRFTFTIGGVPSPDARYNCNIPQQCPPSSAFLSFPTLEGNSNGILTFDFDAPTPTLAFGVARNTILTLNPGLTVQLFAPGLSPIGTFPLITANAGFVLSEGLFTFSGPLVSRAVLTFNSPQTAARFGVDNLTFEAIPEPSTLFLLAAGLASAAGRFRSPRKPGVETQATER